MNRINPGDYADYFDHTVNVEGIPVPRELLEQTYGLDDVELDPKMRCREHLETGECADHDQCYGVHFHPVDVFEDNRITTKSAGAFAPTAGLLHFVLDEPTRGAKICQDLLLNKTCPRDRRCTFLHTFPRDAGAAKKAKKLVDELVGDSPSKSTKKHAHPGQPVRAGDTNLFPTLDGDEAAAPPAPAAPAAPAPKKAVPAPKGPVGAAAVVATAPPKAAASRHVSVPATAPVAAEPAKKASPKVPTKQPVKQPHVKQPAPAPAVQQHQQPNFDVDKLIDDDDDDDGDTVLATVHAVTSRDDPSAHSARALDPDALADILGRVAGSTGYNTASATPAASAPSPHYAAGQPASPGTAAFTAGLNLQAGTILSVAALEPYAFATLPPHTLPPPEAVQAALRGLLEAIFGLAPSTHEYRVAVALYRSAVGNLSELLSATCPPFGHMKSDNHRWAGYMIAVQKIAAPLILSSDALHVLLNVKAADATPRPTSVLVITSVIRLLANAIDARAPKELREAVMEQVDAITLLELADCARRDPDCEQHAQTLLGLAVGAIYRDELRLDTDAKRWVIAALRNLARHGADEASDGAIGSLMQAVTRRVSTLTPLLADPNIVDQALVPLDTILVQIEQVTAEVALQRWSLECRLADRRTTDGTTRSGHEVYAVRSPGDSQHELWLCVEIDPSQCLSFQQWIPGLFIGQYVTIAAIEGAGGPTASMPLQQYRCIAMSIRAHLMYIKMAPQHADRPPWRPNSTKLRVQVEHNRWHLDALLHVRRNKETSSFEEELSRRSLRHGAQHGNLRFGAPSLELDPMQAQFVQHVLWKPRLVVLRGPPGTGKTHSTVAAIEMIVKNGFGRVLACATSNYATNVLASFLHAEGINVTRIFSESVAPLDVRSSTFKPLLNICNPPMCPRRNCTLTTDEITLDSKFGRATGEYLKRFDVVCATTAHIQWMARANVDFKYVFIDECAQGTAAETMLPLTIAPRDATLVLVGDSKQLGPAIVSDIARHHGLANSFFEKYEQFFDPCSVTGKRSPVMSTTLKQCYRCHPEILAVFNQLYYNNYLESGAAPDSFAPVNCAFRRNPESRILFVDVEPQVPATGIFGGFQSSAGDESSGVTALGADTYDNPAEADAIVSAVRSLLRDNGPAFMSKIGIITSFRHQVLTITARLRREIGPIDDLLIGTVDQYQGQERTVILISMVRHTRDNLLPGSSMPVGFVGNNKKTNVAISRAESLLIIFGSKAGLGKQPRTEPWRNIVDMLYRKSAVVLPSEVRQATLQTHRVPLQQQKPKNQHRNAPASNDADW